MVRLIYRRIQTPRIFTRMILFLKPYFRALNQYYQLSMVPAQFVVFGVQPFDKKSQDNSSTVLQELLKQTFISGPVEYWLDDMSIWAQIQNVTLYDDIEQSLIQFNEFVETEAFNATLSDGRRKEIIPAKYRNDIVPYKQLYASRSVLQVGRSTETKVSIQILDTARDVIENYSNEHGVQYVLWEDTFRWVDRDAKMVQCHFGE
eukprot:TRINITY_DN11108_c0_g1_i2.p1 TRINITY_DN11108_c0_g1~~TRINITY_DN11108_c0_g1_i2.p1  ORF type:complete len:204 (+),score=16.33 TRINITY_DN11108_c0_g1_i2:80-691(+)